MGGRIFWGGRIFSGRIFAKAEEYFLKNFLNNFSKNFQENFHEEFVPAALYCKIQQLSGLKIFFEKFFKKFFAIFFTPFGASSSARFGHF